MDRTGEVTAVERIAYRDLSSDSRSILRRVAAGESFEITRDGEVVGVLSPVSTSRGLQVAKEAKRRGGWATLAKRPLSRPTTEIIDELREERL